MMAQRSQHDKRKVKGRDVPWDGPRPMRRQKKEPAPQVPQIAFTFSPAYDRENPLADLFPTEAECR
jgi:hypothetical protein